MQLFSQADRAADVALVAGLAVDDEPAATAFVRRFQGPVFGLAVSITHDATLAQDVSQEVFVRAWRAARTYDVRRASVLTWLLTITRNAAIDAVRARRQTPTDQDVLEELIATTMQAPNPEEEAVRHAEWDAAVARLRALPPEQARAVVLAVIGGSTAREVSEHEGIPLGTAKTRIRDGLRRVRIAMESDGAATDRRAVPDLRVATDRPLTDRRAAPDLRPLTDRPAANPNGKEAHRD